MRLIEDLASANADLAAEYGITVYEMVGVTLPSTCVVEDDDGMRLLLVPTATRVRAHTWARAHAAGVVAIASPADPTSSTTPTLWAIVSVENFIAFRREHHPSGMYLLDGDLFDFTTVVVGIPTYRNFLLAMEEQKPTSNKPGGFVHLHAHSEYCLAPETRVCTADLRWKSIGEVVEGEHLVGFGEDLRGQSSRMERTVVERTSRQVRDCYRITLEDGREIIASDRHGWVAVGSKGSIDFPGGPSRRYGGNGRRWVFTSEIEAGRTLLVA